MAFTATRKDLATVLAKTAPLTVAQAADAVRAIDDSEAVHAQALASIAAAQFAKAHAAHALVGVAAFCEGRGRAATLAREIDGKAKGQAPTDRTTKAVSRAVVIGKLVAVHGLPLTGDEATKGIDRACALVVMSHKVNADTLAKVLTSTWTEAQDLVAGKAPARKPARKGGSKGGSKGSKGGSEGGSTPQVSAPSLKAGLATMLEQAKVAEAMLTAPALSDQETQALWDALMAQMTRMSMRARTIRDNIAKQEAKKAAQKKVTKKTA